MAARIEELRFNTNRLDGEDLGKGYGILPTYMVEKADKSGLVALINNLIERTKVYYLPYDSREKKETDPKAAWLECELAVFNTVVTYLLTKPQSGKTALRNILQDQCSRFFTDATDMEDKSATS